MIKKILASTLSVLFVASSFITGNNKNVIECDKRQSDAILNDGKNQYDLQATNSLGNYITQSAKDNNINPDIKPLSNNINETFNITNLGFDAESGIIVATSIQTQNCTIVFSFIDEDTKQTIQEVKRNVEQGEYVLTEAKADIASLSQYYTVQAQLIDKKGKVISNTFKLDKYTKIMQEIATTDIHDFDGEQVVNFDDNDETNFLVLSEETVKAECSEEENTLASADYDSSTFVFENINESIRYLQNGDLLYIQPDDENIIAVAVDDIEIDGDTAILKGSDDIDDMFEFIKIESQMETGDIEVDTTEADKDVSYPQYNEKRFFYPSNQMLDFNVNMKNAIKYDYEKEYTFRFPRDELFDDKFFGAEAELYGNITFKVNFNFFKKGKYKSSGLSITCIDSITFCLGGELYWDANQLKRYKDEKSLSADEYEYLYDPDRIPFGDYEYEYDPEKNKESIDKHKADLEKRIELGGFKIPTGVPGIFIGVQPVLVLSASGSIEVSVTVSRSWGYVYNSNDGFQKLSDDDSKYDGCSVKIGGEVFIGLQLKAELLVIHEKLLAVSLEVTAGLVTSAETEIDVIDEILEKQSESGHVVITDKDEDYIHSCALCFYGTVSLRVKFGITVSIVKERFEFPIKATHDFPLPFDWCEYCFGITSKPYTWHNDLRVAYDDNPEEKVCPHNKYKVEFIITDENKGNGLEGAEVTIDGLTQNTNSEGRAVFYCDNGSYSYQLKFGNKTQSGKVRVDNNKVSIPGTFDWTLTDDGEVKVKKAIVTSYKDGNRKIVTTTTRTTKPLITETVCKEEDKICESLQLGDNIWGFVYPDNSLYIYGSGDMYSDTNLSFKNAANIEKVVIDDNNSENEEHITSIGNGLFKGCTNLELITYEGSPNEGKKAFDLPDTIISIGDSAFEGCSNLCGDIVFSDKLEKIGNYAFQDCTGITAITVPGSVKEIGIKAFMDCTNLKKAVFKEGIEDIGWGTLAGCESLEDLTLPFAGINLEAVESENRSIDIDGGVNSRITSIFSLDKYSDRLSYSYKLKNVTITGGTRIPPHTLDFGSDNNGFHALPNPITNIILPNSITCIEKNAFSNCSSLETINLPSSVEYIGDRAFSSIYNDGLCEKMTISNFELPSSLKFIGNSAFQNCTSLTEELIVPGSVETIGNDAFNGCTSIKKAVFEKGIVNIGRGTLANCSALEDLTLPYAGLSLEAIESENRALDKEGGMGSKIKHLFAIDKYGDYFSYPPELKNITITGGTKIAPYSLYFEGANNPITSITLADSITQIEKNAFYGCSNLEQLNMPSGLVYIGPSAFRNCSGLEKIYFHDELKEIQTYAFDGTGGENNKVEEVNYEGSSEQWENNVTKGSYNDPILKGKLSFNVPAPNDEVADHIYGDTNGDGQIDMSDAVLIMQALANPNKYGVNGTDPRHISADGFIYGDVDGYGLTVNDALRIQQYLLETIDSLVA